MDTDCHRIQVSGKWRGYRCQGGGVTQWTLAVIGHRSQGGGVTQWTLAVIGHRSQGGGVTQWTLADCHRTQESGRWRDPVDTG